MRKPILLPIIFTLILFFVPGALPSFADDSHLNINIGGECVDPTAPKLEMSFIIKGEAYMYLWSFLDTTDVKRMWNDFIYIQKNTDIKIIHMFINSGGGSAFAGLALADEITRIQREGIKIIAHASGIVASATVPILAACSERFASPGTIFMVHQPAFTKFLAVENADDIRAQNELMDMLREQYLQKLTDRTKITLDQWREMEQRTTWFDSKKALEIGLIDATE